MKRRTTNSSLTEVREKSEEEKESESNLESWVEQEKSQRNRGISETTESMTARIDIC